MKKQSKKSFLFLLLIVPFILNAQVWEYKDSGTDFILLDLSIPPGQDQIAYAAGSQYTVDSEGIIIKTVDGGETWENILFVNDSTGCADLVVDPSNPNKLIAAMWEYGRKPYFFNSGGEGSVVVSKVSEGKDNFGYNAKDGTYVDMLKSGIIDPKKVTRVALENAASVSGMILTTECALVDIKEEVPAAPPMGGGMPGMM